MKKIKALSGFLNNYLTFFVILATVIALFCPGIFMPFSKIKVIGLSFTSSLLAVIMFCTGMSIKAKDMMEMLKKPKTVVCGVIMKFLLMSVGAYLIAKVLMLDNEIAFGLVLLGCMPPGTASGVMVLLAGGEVTLSVAITVLSTLLAPVLTPALTFVLGGEWVQVNFLDMFVNITTVVLIPIIFGMIVRGILKERCDEFKPVTNLISVISLLLIVAVSTSPNTGVILSFSSIIIMAAIILSFAVTVLGSLGLSKVLRLNREKASALMITSSEQNSGLSIGIAATFAATYPLASVPSIIAVSLNVLLATALANYLGHKKKKCESIIVEEKGLGGAS